MPYITVQDGTEIYYKVWGPADGPTVVFSHGWPLNGDNWESQMFFLGQHGYRCIAHDRRGHGRSSQPWDGNNMGERHPPLPAHHFSIAKLTFLDTYSDDLYALFEHLNLKDVCMVGHSTGGGEVARFLGRHGTDRVRKAVLVSAITPLMLKTDTNPKGTPLSIFDSFRTAQEKDRAQWYIDIPTGPFFGFNREGAKVSQGLIWAWWQAGMIAGFKGTYDCINVFSETDLREDLKKIDIPVMVIHG